MSQPTLSPALTAYLTTLLRADEAPRAQVKLASSHRFRIAGKDVDAPHVAVATSERVLVVAVVDEANAWHKGWELGDSEVTHESGLLRDTLVIAQTRWELPMGGGRAGRAFVEGLGAQPAPAVTDNDAPVDTPTAPATGESLNTVNTPQPPAAIISEPVPAPEPLPAEPAPALPFLGELWRGSPPPALAALWRAKLAPTEPLLALLETGTTPPVAGATAIWFGVTTERAVVTALLDADGRETLWSELPLEGLRTAPGQVTRDTFLHGDDVLFAGPLLGKDDLRAAFGLASLKGLSRLDAAAALHIARSRLDGARALLDEAWRRADLDGPADQVTEPAAVSITLRRTRLDLLTASPEAALDTLVTASRLAPSNALLTEAHTHGLDDLPTLCMLAAAHAAAGHPASAAAVYDALHTAHPTHDLFLVERARALLDAGQADDALAAWARFIDGRRTDDAFVLLTLQSATQTDPALTAADPDLAAALLDSAAALEALDRPAEAAARYLDLIRAAPTLDRAYTRLFALHDALPPDDAFFAAQASVVLRLLRPELADQLLAEGKLPPPPPALDLPARYRTLTAEDHDTRLVHPGEREATNATWKWFARLVRRTRTTDDIEKHCERIDGHNHPLPKALITHASHLLGLPTPRCFLSHGASGAQVLGTDNPFLFLGAEHVAPTHERHLPPHELCFALAGQMAHIRANHLLLTNSEFWADFGSRALDGLVTLISILPLTSTVGKAIDAVTLKWVQRLQQGAQARLTRTLMELAHTRVADGVGQGTLQSAIDALQRKVTTPLPVDQQTLVKEQLASFARAALFTSDRVGLLACDDLAAATHAIFRLGPNTVEELVSLDTYGLAHILARKDHQGRMSYHELALRLGELFKFAMSEDYRVLRERYVVAA